MPRGLERLQGAGLAVPQCADQAAQGSQKEAAASEGSASQTTVEQSAEIQVGNDITNIEAVRAHLKSPFERNVITNWNHQEQIFDYIFTKMGFDGQDKIDHPIILTEALANPNFCRQQMNELLFECYGIPSVSYGIDALYSWKHHQQKQKNVVYWPLQLLTSN